MKKIILFAWLLLFATTFSACQSDTPDVVTTPNPQNVILLIGDGMGLTQIQAAMMVKGSPLNMQRCSYIAFSKTKSASSKITDSAAGATAMACGVKTNNGAIGVDAKGNAVKSVLHYAEDAGLATGLVATSTITHATPAGFIAHESSRQNYEAIARDFLDTDIEVFIGGGLNHFKHRKDGVDLTAQLQTNGYQLVLNESDLAAIKSGKIAGLLNTDAMPPMTEGRGDMLLNATTKAIEILKQDEDGFFLMVEGSQIDWGGHNNDIEYVVTELLDFDKVVGAVLDFAEQDGNTLVIITADHETGGLTIKGEDILGDPAATNFSTDYHTPVMVPVYAYGPQAERFQGTFENTRIFTKMMAALQLTKQ